MMKNNKNETNANQSTDEQVIDDTRHNTFLNKIKKYNARRRHVAKQNSHAQKAQASRLATQRLTKGHQKAAATINVGQLEAIHLISQGDIRTCSSAAKLPYTVLDTIKTHDNEYDPAVIVDLEITRDGKWLISLDNKSNLTIRSVEHIRESRSAHLEQLGSSATLATMNIASTSNSKEALIPVSSTLQLWDIEKLWDIENFQEGGSPTTLDPIPPNANGWAGVIIDVTITPDGKRVIAAVTDNMLVIWDKHTRKILTTLDIYDYGGVWSMAVTPDSKQAISMHDNWVSGGVIWDLDTYKKIGEFPNNAANRGTVITPDGKRVIFCESRRLTVWSWDDQKQIATLEGHTDNIIDMAMSVDGTKVVSASMDLSLKVWDLNTYKEIMTLEGHTNTVVAVAITPDGQKVISVCASGEIKVWWIGTVYNNLCDLILEPTTGDLYAARSEWPNEIGLLKKGVDGPLQLLYKVPKTISSIAVQKTGEAKTECHIYWITDDNTLWKGDLKKTKPKVIIANLPGLIRQSRWQIAIDLKNDKLYWTNDREIWSANMDGTQIQIAITNADAPFPVELAVDGENGWIFWIDKDMSMLCRADLSGDNIKHLYPISNPGFGLDIDPGQKTIYWVERKNRLNNTILGLAGLWRFETGEGHTTPDLSGHGQQATLHAVTWEQPMIPPPSRTTGPWVLQFDGEKGYITLEPIRLHDAKGFSIEMWLRLDKLDQSTMLFEISSDPRSIDERQNNSGNRIINDTIALTIGDLNPADPKTKTPKTMRLALNVANKTTTKSVKSDELEMQLNQWVHVAATVKNDGHTALFIDGQRVAKGVVDLPGTSVRNVALFGKSSQQDSPDFLSGQLAELRLWNHARSAHQIEIGMKDFSTSYVMSGPMDGRDEPHSLYEAPGSQGGLTVQSNAKQAHAQRLESIHIREQAAKQVAEQRKQAHANAQKSVQVANDQLTAHHVVAAKTLDTAHQLANTKRAQAHSNLNAAHTKARTQVTLERQSAVKKRQQAKTSAEKMKSDAHARGNEAKRKAQDKLNKANTEKSKY